MLAAIRRLVSGAGQVDGLPVLGGQAVNSIVGTICGMFSNGADGYQVTYGIAEDIIRDLSKTGAIHYRQGVNNIIVYDEVALGRWIENAIREAGITVLLGAIVREVEVKERRIRSVFPDPPESFPDEPI